MQLLNSTFESKENEKYAQSARTRNKQQNVSISLKGSNAESTLSGGKSFPKTISDRAYATSSTLFAPELSGVNEVEFLDGAVGNSRLFGIRLEIGVIGDLNVQISDTVSLILKGAGFQQDAQRFWTTGGCDIEEATDSLSDVFLEFQSLDIQEKDNLGRISLTLCEENLANIS